jgi:hypothetical protein
MYPYLKYRVIFNDKEDKFDGKSLYKIKNKYFIFFKY